MDPVPEIIHSERFERGHYEDQTGELKVEVRNANHSANGKISLNVLSRLPQFIKISDRS